MNTIPIDVINHQLPPRQLYQLKQVSHHFHTFISDSDIIRAAINVINHRLSLVFKDNLTAFKTLLKSNNAVISGSFVLQCLLGEHWEDSDIDVYVPTKNDSSRLDDFLNNTMQFPLKIVDDCYHNMDLAIQGVKTYATMNNVCLTLAESLKPADVITMFDKFGEYPLVKNANETQLDYYNRYHDYYEQQVYGDKMRRIQIIEVDVEPTTNTMVDYIQKSFDFDLCKNIYAMNGREMLIIDKLNHVMNKTTSYNITTDNVERCQRRQMKYEDRGFVFMCGVFDELSE